MQAMQSVLNVPTTDDHIVTQHSRSNSEKTEKFGPGPSDAVGSKPEMADMKTSQGSGSGKTFYHPHPLPMPEFGGWFAPLTGMLIRLIFGIWGKSCPHTCTSSFYRFLIFVNLFIVLIELHFIISFNFKKVILQGIKKSFQHAQLNLTLKALSITHTLTVLSQINKLVIGDLALEVS